MDIAPHINRETWLNRLAEKMAPRFAELGHPIPRFRVAVGWTSAGKASHIGGECWHSKNSADKVFEILIAPILDDSMTVAATLAHELNHAAVGFKHGHKGEFAKNMVKLGLLRPFTSSTAGPFFIEWVQPFINELGAIPHARIILQRERSAELGENADEAGEDDDEGGSSNQKKKQTTRMKKCLCETCRFTVRITQKWLDTVGAPHCPDHGAMREAE